MTSLEIIQKLFEKKQEGKMNTKLPMTRNIGYKRIGLSYAEQINIVSTNGNTVYYIVQKNGRDFGGIHTTSSDRIITEAEAKTSKRIYA